MIDEETVYKKKKVKYLWQDITFQAEQVDWEIRKSFKFEYLQTNCQAAICVMSHSPN